MPMTYVPIPEHLSDLRWPVPPVQTARWGRDAWVRYVLSMCVCPNPTPGTRCEQPNYSQNRTVTEVAPSIYQTTCNTCGHKWGPPPEQGAR